MVVRWSSSAPDPTLRRVGYDEFSLFEENADEAGLAWSGPPIVRRGAVDVEGGRRVSALTWGTAPPEVVLLHGGGQNAHTWDTVALALGRPLVALDLPGHGHSDWRGDHDYSPIANEPAVAAAVHALAPDAQLLVGMSLGGVTAIRVAALHPDLVRRLLVVDVTPGVDETKAEPIIAFLSGPETFSSFDEILERTVQFNPTRSVSSLRRGVLHNAREEPDGSWTWRYDPVRSWKAAERPAVAFTSLWDDVERIKAPMLLVRGGLSGVVSDDDVAELQRRKPDAEVVTVEGAGHSIQGDKPVELATILERFVS
jgi:pimeloyl-ACP methyl ester carboxylesterase